MPPWLQVVASLNPLSYAIEPIRYIYGHADWAVNSIAMETSWFGFSFTAVILVLLAFDALILLAIQPLLRRRFA